MAKGMNSKFGKVDLLKNNPRTIRDNQFSALVESITRDEEFMDVRKIVVWRVPPHAELPEGVKNPFEGQEGELVCIGGNQRIKALMTQGMKSIPDEWIVEAKDEKGEWWPPDRAQRFVMVDNSQPGNSGENDFEKLAKFFDEQELRLSGVDFSEFVTSTDEAVKGTLGDVEGEGGPEEELEQGEHGEKSEELQAFIAEREKTRANLKEIDETGFHLCMIFDSIEDKARFVSGAGLCGSGGKIAGNGTTYVDLVFETERQKLDFAEKAGLMAEDDEGDPRLMYGMFCDGRYIAEKMGIELSASGLHFRDRIVDQQLAKMARDEEPQKTPEEIAEGIYAKLKAERDELGMPVPAAVEKRLGGGSVKGKGRKGRGKAKAETADEPENGPGIYVDMGDDEGSEDMPNLDATDY